MTTRTTFAGLIVLTLLVPGLALGQSNADTQFRATVYGFFRTSAAP